MNTWRWDSVEEFKKHVQPIEHAPQNAVHSARCYTALEHVGEFFRVVYELRDAHERLQRIVESTTKEPTSPFSEDQFRELHVAGILIVLNGEYALAYCKPLAETKGGGEFIAKKVIFENLPRCYRKEGSRGCKDRANCLLKATDQLLKAIHVFLESENSFLNYVSALPEDLKVDFVTARDVMSLGFDEAGLIYAGRGLEGVVRRIAKDHKVNFGEEPIERARFFKILTALEAKRFLHDQSLVINAQTKQRLHLSRVMQNYSAHPNTQRGSQGYREEAILMAQKANELWKKCSAPGIKFV